MKCIQNFWAENPKKGYRTAVSYLVTHLLQRNSGPGFKINFMTVENSAVPFSVRSLYCIMNFNLATYKWHFRVP